MDLQKTEQRMMELEQRYQEWAEPVNRVIKENFQRINREGYNGEDFFRQIKEAREKRLAEFDPFLDAYLFFDELIPLYRISNEEKRTALRSMLKKNGGMLNAMLGYVHRCAKAIHGPEDAQKLDAGLLAACLENCGRDYRDTLLALAELYVCAEAGGLDAKHHFQEISILADDEELVSGGTTMKEMLFNFHRCAVLQERRQKGRNGLWT